MFRYNTFQEENIKGADRADQTARMRRLVCTFGVRLHLSKKDGKHQKRYNQVAHLTQDPHGKVTKNTINITSKSQEVSRFPAGDHKAAMNRCECMRNTRRKKHK